MAFMAEVVRSQRPDATHVLIFVAGVVLACMAFCLIRARLTFYYRNVRPGLVRITETPHHHYTKLRYCTKLRYYTMSKYTDNEYKPMPKWNPVFGHLLLMRDLLNGRLPFDVARPEIFAHLSRQGGESGSLLYVDLWPFIPPLLIVSSPEYAAQACQKYDLAKPKVLVPFLRPVVGGNSVFTANGAEWHRDRSLFSPWFSSGRAMSTTAKIVREAAAFVHVLRGHAEAGRTFLFNEAAMAYTMDVSAAVILDHPFAAAMISNMTWHYTAGLKSKWVRWTPLLPSLSWYNNRRMNKYLSGVIDTHFAAQAEASSKNPITDTSSEALLDFVLAQQPKQALGPALTPDAKYKRWLTTQLRLFMFTGFASSAPTISYCYYLLSRHAAALAKLRAEHTQVYGADAEDAARQLCERPHSLNQLPYTSAVIKETLRLFPPASSFRQGSPEAHLYDGKGSSEAHLHAGKGGRRFPTDGMHIWVIHSALHRDPGCWVEADGFVPERWLAGPDDALYPPQGSFRPFERGPRACMGQTLAMHSLRITLVMTARLFGFQAMYGEADAGSVDGRVIRTLNGERAYPVGDGGSQPADGMPCRILLGG